MYDQGLKDSSFDLIGHRAINIVACARDGIIVTRSITLLHHLTSNCRKH